jgi:hypothetical protein
MAMMQPHNRKAIGKTPAKTAAKIRELSLRPVIS